jgi:hypothetical protein
MIGSFLIRSGVMFAFFTCACSQADWSGLPTQPGTGSGTPHGPSTPGGNPPSHSSMPTNPVIDPDFMKLPEGRDLKKTSVSGLALTLATGEGQPFTAAEKAAYEKLKTNTQTIADYPVQWVFMDLDNHRVIDKSINSNTKIFGASVAKIFTAATLLDKQGGHLSDSQFQTLADMLVVSSNTAWFSLQDQIGDGDTDRGRAGINAFTQRMGYLRTRGWQGYWGNLHGNELTANELGEFLYDMYMGKFPGAEVQWKLMHTCRTGGDRARRYLPKDLYVGAKTGTYEGPTMNPETQSMTNPDGSPYTVDVRNQIIVFNVNNHEYAIAILANTGSEDTAALLAGGLFRELSGF